MDNVANDNILQEKKSLLDYHFSLVIMVADLQIKQHFRDGILHKNEFKVVYVAPMKVSVLDFFIYVLVIGQHFES